MCSTSRLTHSSLSFLIGALWQDLPDLWCPQILHRDKHVAYVTELETKLPLVLPAPSWESQLTGSHPHLCYSLQGSGPDPEMVPALHGPPRDEEAMYLEHLPVYRVCWTARPGQGMWRWPQEVGGQQSWCGKVQLMAPLPDSLSFVF